MTDEKQWRKFMDQKWAEYHRDRKDFNSKYGVEHLRPAPNLLSNLADKPKTKKAEEKRTYSIVLMVNFIVLNLTMPRPLFYVK